MKITSIIWENVRVEFPELKKVYDWKDCMIIYREKFMSIYRMEKGIRTEDHLTLGHVQFNTVMPWSLSAEVTGVFDDKLWKGTVEAEF